MIQQQQQQAIEKHGYLSVVTSKIHPLLLEGLEVVEMCLSTQSPFSSSSTANINATTTPNSSSPSLLQHIAMSKCKESIKKWGGKILNQQHQKKEGEEIPPLFFLRFLYWHTLVLEFLERVPKRQHPSAAAGSSTASTTTAGWPTARDARILYGSRPKLMLLNQQQQQQQQSTSHCAAGTVVTAEQLCSRHSIVKSIFLNELSTFTQL
eukprot:1396122-Ditylum_brightwellii.AAC.1